MNKERRNPENSGSSAVQAGRDPWAEARGLIDAPGGSVNIAYEAVDRHVASGHGSDVAMVWLGKSGTRASLAYSDLKEASARLANVLSTHGLSKGDSVFALMGRVPELYIAALGTLKAGMVFTPLFSAFGPEPIQTRMEIGSATALATTAAL